MTSRSSTGLVMTGSLLGLAMLGGCSMGEGMDGGSPLAASAVASLQTAGGANVGRAVATTENAGIRIMLDVRGMPPGEHGVHVHTVGRCEGPGFETAGGHWNPGATQHGTRNPAGPHAGDLPNLTVGADGTGTLSMVLPAGSIDTMLDADGAAFVVHATADDLATDPSGNSGGRIACGVFARS